MADIGDEVVVIRPDSPLVERMVNKRIVAVRGGDVPLTSAQRLQSNPVLVAEVLNHCFWASVAHEEGRPVASGLTFTGPDEQGLSEPLCLARPETLTVESLVRLGTVAGTASRLAVHEYDGKPHIWGLLRGNGPPYWVTVWFDRPAALRVMVENGFVLGILSGGSIRVPQGHLLANHWEVRSQLQMLLGTLRTDVTEAFMHLANEMSRYGHGGTLLVVPETLEWKRFVDFKYDLAEHSQTLLQRLIESSDPRRAPTADGHAEYAQESLTQAVQQVASLTRIDGAVVIGVDLAVFGFGARISDDLPVRGRPVVQRKTIYEQSFAEVDWAKLGGMRHQSAARFVATIKTAWAFVASHDGTLSAFAWKDAPAPGHLEWLRGLEALIPPH